MNSDVLRSDNTCKNYVLPIDSEIIKPSNNRIMGDVINKESLDRWKKDKLDYEPLRNTLGSMLHSFPIIQCNGFPLNVGTGAGSPIFNNEGSIVGMSIGGFDSYVVAIRACSIKSSIELWKSYLERNANKKKRETDAKKKSRRNKEDHGKEMKSKEPQIKSMEATGHRGGQTNRQRTNSCMSSQNSHLVWWDSLLTQKTMGQSSQLPFTNVKKNDKVQRKSILHVNSENQENSVNFSLRKEGNFARADGRSGRSHTSADLDEIICCWTHALQRIHKQALLTKKNNGDRADGRSGRSYTSVFAGIIRCWTHALQCNHKQALQLAKENTGDRSEFLQNAPDDSSGEHVEALAEILFKHEQHLASIKFLNMDCSSNAISDLASRLSAVKVDKVLSSRSTSKLSPSFRNKFSEI